MLHSFLFSKIFLRYSERDWVKIFFLSKIWQIHNNNKFIWLKLNHILFFSINDNFSSRFSGATVDVKFYVTILHILYHLKINTRNEWGLHTVMRTMFRVNFFRNKTHTFIHSALINKSIDTNLNLQYYVEWNWKRFLERHF